MLSCYVRLPLVLIVWVMIGGVFGMAWTRGFVLVLDAVGPVWGGSTAAIERIEGVLDFACVLPVGLLWSDPAPPVVLSMLFTAPAIVCVVYYLRKSRSTLVELAESNPAERPSSWPTSRAGGATGRTAPCRTIGRSSGWTARAISRRNSAVCSSWRSASTCRSSSGWRRG